MLTVILLFALLYAFVTYLVAGRQLADFDLATSGAIQTVSFLPIDYVSSIISLLIATEITVPAALLGALVLYRKGKHWAALGLLVVVVLVLLGILFKSVIAQPAPDEEVFHRYAFSFSFPTARVAALFFSFPSGHVARAAFLCGYTAYLGWHGRSLARYLLLAFLTITLLVVGYTRVYSGEHWFSDVAGGYLLGGLGVLFAIWLAERDNARWHMSCLEPK